MRISMLVVAALAVLTVITRQAAADDLQNLNSMYDRVLLPLAPTLTPLPGANGSRWVVEALARNNAPSPIYITPIPPLPGTLYPDYPPSPAPVGTSLNFPQLVAANGGEFIFVTVGYADNVPFSLRVQDISRQLQTWGTAIPVVRERDVYTRRVTLLNVPIQPQYRVTLRMYDFDEAADRRVQVRILDSRTDAVLAETQLTLSKVLGPLPPSSYFVPGSAMIGDLVATYPQLKPSASVRVEIELITPGLRCWAFASVTDNDTQHVTLVLPQ